MDTQANVTLKALTGDVSLAERTITLNPNRLTIPIGRASKSLTKGILGASDNAWFDSPVMSRDHAEMCLNPEINIVTVHDIGSMHGTYINNKQLSVRDPTRISDGDEITFGAEVKRGPETFPACAFQVKIDFVPYKAANSYTFPDSSDIEEEEDYDLSDDVMQDGGHSSSEDDVSIEMPSPVKISQAINAIDLTRDESPFVASSNRIDLTGETPAEIHVNKTANAPEVADSTETDSSEDDDLQEIEDSESEDDVEVDVEIDSEVEDDSDAEGVDSVMDGYTDDLGEGMHGNHLHTDTGRYLGADLKPFEFIPEQTEASEDILDGDDESDYGLSDAGAEGIRALFEDGLLHSDSGVSEPTSNKEPEAEIDQQTTDATPIASPSISYPQAWDGDAVGLLCKAATLNPPAKFTHTLRQPFPGERQPSPSDAAMVKAAPHKHPEQTQNDAPVFHSQSQTFGRLAQTLGDKTGKHAFFEARENNKAKVNTPVNREDDISTPSFSPSSSALFANVQKSKDEHIATHQSLASNTSKIPANAIKFGEPFKFANSSSTNKPGDFATAPDRSVFSLDFHNQPQSLKRAPSPEYDMTSAVKFNESKAKSVRSRLSIHDIIENSSRDQSPQKLSPKVGEKRKAGEISNVIENEIREWASLGTSNPSELASSNLEATKSGQQVRVTDASAPQADDQRPAKKLKTILERAAYAAVGGVAVGAGLFFSLVATAPDFA